LVIQQLQVSPERLSHLLSREFHLPGVTVQF
jgi:hypothetical protein